MLIHDFHCRVVFELQNVPTVLPFDIKGNLNYVLMRIKIEITF